MNLRGLCFFPVRHKRRLLPCPKTPRQGKQPGKDASLQTSKHASLQAGKQILIEKYSSYLTHKYKRELKRIAFESDRNEYEVLMEAVELYLTSRKRLK